MKTFFNVEDLGDLKAALADGAQLLHGGLLALVGHEAQVGGDGRLLGDDVGRLAPRGHGKGAGDVDEADAKEPETLTTPVVPTEKPEEDSSSTGTTVELTGGMSVIKDQTPEEEKKPAPGIPKAMPYIIRVNTKERVMVNKAVFKLGKANRGVDFRIDGNGAISRVHAIIYQRDDGCYLKDNKATNATLVDGVKLEEGQEVKLKNDAMITIGGEDFIFKLS